MTRVIGPQVMNPTSDLERKHPQLARVPVVDLKLFPNKTISSVKRPEGMKLLGQAGRGDSWRESRSAAWQGADRQQITNPEPALALARWPSAETSDNRLRAL